MSEVLKPGDMCGPYEIERELGRGGMGIVYLAHNADRERRAIKTLQLIGRFDAQHDERFKREISVLAMIEHVHVVRFYEAGRLETHATGEVIWMALQYLEGPTLRQIIRERGGRIPAEDIIRWGKQMADGLAAVHALRVIHRDLKPENVAIVNGDVKIFDFGISKMAEWGAKTTDHKIRLGTAGYMAPEQMNGSALDRRADVYPLGLILWELAVGHHPHKNSRDEEVQPGELIARTFGRTIKPVKEYVPNFPDYVDEIILKALSRDPNDRYQSAKQMRSALSKALQRHKEERRGLLLGKVAGTYVAPPSALDAAAADLDPAHEPTRAQPAVAEPPPTVIAPAPKSARPLGAWEPNQKRTVHLGHHDPSETPPPVAFTPSQPAVALRPITLAAQGMPAAPSAPISLPPQGRGSAWGAASGASAVGTTNVPATVPAAGVRPKHLALGRIILALLGALLGSGVALGSAFAVKRSIAGPAAPAPQTTTTLPTDAPPASSTATIPSASATATTEALPTSTAAATASASAPPSASTQRPAGPFPHGSALRPTPSASSKSLDW
jgi:serine/threonine protein kinase